MTTPSSPTKIEWTVSIRTVLRVLLTAVIFSAAITALVTLRDQVAWVAISFFLALALTPAVNLLSRYLPRKSRGLAMAIVLIITIAILSYLILVLIPPLIDQLITLVKNFPTYWNDFIQSNGVMARYARELNLADLATKNQDKLSGVLNNVGGVLGGVAGGLIALITIITLTFFMVVEGEKWLSVFWRYQTPAKRERRQKLAAELHRTVTGYMGGNLATSGVAAVVTTAFLLILGIPSPLALGLLVGVVDLIPLVGATLAAILVSLFALVYGGTNAGIITIVFFIIYQQVENNLLQPLVYSKSVNVSPLVVGIAAVCGGALAGFFGALVAIPVAASLQILTKHFLENKNAWLDNN
jgi:predicted PurR-regulated permease PerM